MTVARVRDSVLLLPPLFYAVVAVGLVLAPLALVVPGPKTLMTGIIACKVTVLDEAFLFMLARKMYLLEEAHLDGNDHYTYKVIRITSLSAWSASL